MDCLNCHAVLSNAARFCVACGAPAPAICPACGFACSPAAKFCSECGARLAGDPIKIATTSGGKAVQASPPETEGAQAERRQLTVLFCDLVGSTEMSSRLDPEDLREVIGAYHRCVAETTAAFDGFVARYMGDGALVYFGYPQGHEDNAERAIRAALALLANIRDLSVQGQELRARIGVATGLVIVGDLVTTGTSREHTALGETPNLAARLQSIAEPDTILVADHTKRLAGERFHYRDLGTIALKGFDVPARAWQVLSAARARSSFATLRTDQAPRADAATAPGAAPLVGRDQELRLLRDRWAQATAGQGRVAMLTGDAGIGKSRLVQALISQVETDAHVMLELRCSAYYTNSPLYPVIALLPGVLSWTREDSDEARLDKLALFCTRYQISASEGLPLLMSLLSMPPSARYPLPPMGPERQRQRTLQILLEAVLAVAAEQPVLAIVEDLQWLDPSTLELLALLVEHVPSVRLFALFTARPNFQPPWPPHAYATPIVLSRLAQRHAEEMVERVAGRERLPRDLVQQIVAKTDGVPLFIEELTKMLVESGLAPTDQDPNAPAGAARDLAIPATLQDSLTARLDRLATVKVIAQLSATIGREFSYALLRTVANVEDTVLRHELARLIDAEFLIQRGEPPDATYVFKHALIQVAAYQSLLKSTRQQYHERIARAMIDQFSVEADAHPEYVAMHFTEAGNAVLGVRWWQKAGQHAFKRAAYTEATAHFVKGLAVLASMSASTQRDQWELGLQVELGYALIPVKGWAAQETAQAFTRAGELGRQIGDTPALFRALWGLGAFYFVRGDQHRARQVAEQCLGVAGNTNDSDALSEAYYLSGITACVMGNFASGQRDLEECIRIYGSERREAHRALYGQDAKASALGWLAMALWVQGQPDEALDRANEALAAVSDATQPFLLARALAGVGFIHVFRKEPQGPDAPLQRAVALCVEQGFSYFRAVVSAFHGANLVNLGRTEEGVAMMQASVKALRTIGSELLFTPLSAYLASAHLALLQIDAGLAAVDDGLACVKRNGERWAEAELYRIRGQLLLARGKQEAARAEACFREALAIARRQGARSYELSAARSLARLWRQQGREGEASAVLAEAVGAWPEDTQTAELREARATAQLASSPRSREPGDPG